jgi:hypothetical protein
MRHIILYLFCFWAMPTIAQTLRGSVVSDQTGQPIPSTNLVFTTHSDSIFTAQSGPDGAFRFERLPVGVGMLSANVEGFAPFLLREVHIAAGKEQVLEVLLSTDQWESNMSPIEVVERRPLRQPNPIGEIPLSRAQTLYNPMTYFDPARLATASAGVAQGDDGTNTMSIRGNNPAFVRWRLQGMDITSPNHLPNAGTLNDLPTSSSGGVLMLSAQMLDNSSLITGAGPLGYNDGIAGIMDLQLRKGNNQHHEQTLQLGLTGLDAAVEGPLSRRKSGSYLFNYRYSFVGILGAMGVSFGGEKITFQDAALHIHLPKRKKSEFSIYALFGQSSNRFQRPDSATVFKELFNIDFSSNSIIFGVTQTNRFGQRFVSKTGISISSQANERSQNTLDNLYTSVNSSETRATLNYNARFAANPNHILVFGTNIGTVSSLSFVGNIPQRDREVEWIGLVQCWLGGEWSLRDGAIQVNYGINPILPSTLDPRFQVRWRMNKHHQLVAAIANNSQYVPFWMESSAKNIMQALHQSVRYNYLPNSNWVLSAELFAQRIRNVLGNDGNGNPVFAVNQSEFQPALSFQNSDGAANNAGLELAAQRRLDGGWFAHANLTLLRSLYTDDRDVTRRTRWDVGQVANLTTGKEWDLRRRRQKLSGRVFGVSGRAIYMGGYRTAPINLAQSVATRSTVYDVSNGYTGRNPDYFRLDGRIYWKRSIGNRRNGTFALEFQNLTNKKNIAFLYYDPLTQSVQTKYQLGLIPNLSWRLEL